MRFTDSFSHDDHSQALALLSAAVPSPEELCQSDPATQLAFETSLRLLAEDIVKYHPSLAHVLIGLSKEAKPFFHGQN